MYTRLVLLVSLLMPPLTVGCDGGMEPEEPGTPSITGRYNGGWNVWAFDTLVTCGVGSCGHPVLDNVGCRVTTEITLQGDRAFVGTFVVDSIPGPGGSGACDLAATGWLNLATRGEMGNGVIDTVWTGGGTASPRVGANMTFVIGQGTPQDLEALVGCTLLESWTTWEMTWGEAGAVFTYYPESQSAFHASIAAPSELEEVRTYGPLFECKGRHMRIKINFHGER